MFEPMMRVRHEPGIMINLNCASDIQKRKQSRINKGGGEQSCSRKGHRSLWSGLWYS